jgi:hypothetical protein
MTDIKQFTLSELCRAPQTKIQSGQEELLDTLFQGLSTERALNTGPGQEKMLSFMTRFMTLVLRAPQNPTVLTQLNQYLVPKGKESLLKLIGRLKIQHQNFQVKSTRVQTSVLGVIYTQVCFVDRIENNNLVLFGEFTVNLDKAYLRYIGSNY